MGQLQQLEQAMAAAMAANIKTQQDLEVFQMKLAVKGGIEPPSPTVATLFRK